MKEKTFRRILTAAFILCLIVTLIHLIYIIYAYQHGSIIYFISRELW